MATLIYAGASLTISDQVADEIWNATRAAIAAGEVRTVWFGSPNDSNRDTAHLLVGPGIPLLIDTSGATPLSNVAIHS